MHFNRFLDSVNILWSLYYQSVILIDSVDPHYNHNCMDVLKKFLNITFRRNEGWDVPSEKIKLLSVIGKGSYGVVFLSELNKELVAVKKLKSQNDIEVNFLKKLRHSNVIKFKGVTMLNSSLSLIMEFCPKGQLYNIIHTQKIVPKNVINWTKQIASGMNYLHSKNIIHGDLKSPNILMNADEILKIADFGNSWTSDNINKKAATGTVCWMAPEQIRNEKCNEKIDIWSYGVIVWEILTCQSPYHSIESSTIIWGVGNDKLLLPIFPTFPCTFALLLKSCWQRNPAKRPSFSAIIDHLNLIDADFKEMDDESYQLLQRCWAEDSKDHIVNFEREIFLSKYACSSELQNEIFSETVDNLKHQQNEINIIFSQIKCLHHKLKKREAELVKIEQSLIPPRWFYITYWSMREKLELRHKIQYALSIQEETVEKLDKLLQVFDSSSENLIYCKASIIQQRMEDIKKELEFCRDCLSAKDVRNMLHCF